MPPILSRISEVRIYGRDFKMDTGFYNRTGVSGGWGYSGINLYPDQERYKWFKKANAFVFTRGYRDRIQGGDEFIAVAGLRLHFTRQAHQLPDQQAVCAARHRPSSTVRRTAF